METLAIFVPTDSSPGCSFIASGAAIVGLEERGERIHVCYEGDIYGFIGGGFANRVYHAADRLLHQAPTIARAFLPASDLVKVATWNHTEGTIGLDDPAILADWLGRTPDTNDLVCELSHYEEKRNLSRMLASGDPRQQFAAKWFIANRRGGRL